MSRHQPGRLRPPAEGAVDFAAWYLRKHSLGIGRLVSHGECHEKWGGTDHTDPTDCFVKYGKSWKKQFKRDVEIVLEGSGRWLRDTSKGTLDRWWLRHADGSHTSNGWEGIDDDRHRFGSAGWMRTGWITWDGHWRHCPDSGKMLSATCREIKGKWYAFAADGAMRENTFCLFCPNRIRTEKKVRALLL